MNFWISVLGLKNTIINMLSFLEDVQNGSIIVAWLKEMETFGDSRDHSPENYHF